MTTTTPDNETTQPIPLPHSTHEFFYDPTRPIKRRRPAFWGSRRGKAWHIFKRAIRPVCQRWGDIWPIVVGIVLGTGAAFGILLCFVIMWIEWG